MVNEELLRDLPEEYSALADRRRVMLEVADELGELHTAVNALGDALETAGLPGRMWRSPDASLRLIARSLPDITVDRLMTRLAEFAAGKGPDWLHGGIDDLDQFHREVRAIARVVDRLSESALQGSALQRSSRPPRAIELAFGAPKVSAALDHVAEILTDFRALEPFMAPLTSDEWRSQAAHLQSPEASTEQARAHGDTLSLSADGAHAKLRDFARATLKPQVHGNNTPGARLDALLEHAKVALAPLFRRPLFPRPLFRRKRLIALEGALLLMTVLAVLLLHHQGIIGSSATRGSLNSGLSATAASATAASATHASATAAVMASPTAIHLAPTKTSVPAPQLALTCAMNAAKTSATLDVKNTGRGAVSWQAAASHWLTVSPSKGQLSVGQTDTAQVTPSSSKRGWGTNTVTVSASNGTQSASFSATCG